MDRTPAEQAVVDEFGEHLARLQQASDGPAQEAAALWRVALERERIVTVAYRRDIIDKRLAGMPIAPAVRDLIGTAIRWVWRDEERHALWVRGVLLNKGSFPERARAWATSMEGAVGGWVASRQHHQRWAEAPLARVVAEVLEGVARLSGRIPKAVQGEMHHLSFRAFCRFSATAERTAQLAWERLAELGNQPSSGISPTDRDAFLRMGEDEGRHQALFLLLADHFLEDDTLRADSGPTALRSGIGAIGQRFLGLPQVGSSAWANRAGKGGEVHVREGRSSAEGGQTLALLLGDLKLPELLASTGPKVAIKTTFMLVTHADDPSPAVAPALLHALIDTLVAAGAQVCLLDSQNYYDRFHAGRTVPEVAAYLGLDQGPHRVVDATDDQAPHPFVRGMGEQSVSASWLAADLRIVFGKLRGHPTTHLMLSLETLEGLGARHDLHLFGDRKVDRATSVMMLLDAAPPHLALIDAFVDVPDGLLGMMGRPDPVHPLRLYGARDPVALDATVARHVGVPAPGLLGTATDWFGDPRAVTQVVGPDTPIAGWRAADQSIRTAVLSALALPVFTHASARGALFMPRFDTQAFPALQPPSSGLRAARAAVWTALEQPGAPSHGPGLLPVHFERHAESLLRVSRTGQGPPIVLLHGYPDTLQVWCRLAGRLAATHTVIALDWPGLGYSGGWGDQADPQALAAQVRRLLQAWDLHDVTLVGADMGGPPALLAADSPRVARVAVIGSLLFADGPTSVEISTMRTIGLAGLAFRWAPRLVWKRCMGTFLRLGERLPEVLEADMFAAFEQPAVRARLAAMCLAYERALPQLPDCYWKVSKPVLTLWGEDDHHFGPEHGARLAALLPNCRAEVCPSGPHWVAWSDPDWVASALTRFCVEGP